MPRLRVIALTLLALAVPSLALGGEEAPSGPQTLSVSASLSGCGLAQAAIVCQIDVGWNALEGADYYTVSVTRSDGSVVDLGQTSGTGRAIFIPYVGPGKYSVQVAAWGTPPGDIEPEVLVREKALSTGDSQAHGKTDSQPGAAGPVGDGRTTGVEVGTTFSGDEPVTEPLASESPDCEEPAKPDPDEDLEAEPDAPVVEDLAAEDETGEADHPDDPDDPPTCR